jgi:hypothetical protein
VKEVIRAASPRKTEDFSDIQKDLQDLLNKFRVKVLGRKLDEQDGDPTDENKSSEPVIDFRHAPEGATSTSLYEVFEKPPKFHMLDKEEEVADKKLKGRGAMFIIETGDLFVNGLYEAVARTIEDIEPEFTGQADPETGAATHRDGRAPPARFPRGQGGSVCPGEAGERRLGSERPQHGDHEGEPLDGGQQLPRRADDGEARGEGRHQGC